MSLPNGTAVMYLPIAASAGASLWGTDVRAMLAAPDATADATSLCAHGTALADTTRTVDPYSSSSADGTEANFGWAIDAGTGAAGMGSTATVKRRMLAGNHVATTRLSHDSTLGDSTATLHFFAYRVGPAAGRARTLLGSVNQAVNLAALNAVGTYTATIALGELVFENDETIQYSFEVTATGVLVTGANSVFRAGTDGGVAVRVDFPELRTIIETVGASTGAATAASSLQTTANMQGASAGAATAAGSLQAIHEMTGASAGAATATGTLAITANMEGASAGAATAAATLAAIANFLGAVSAAATAAGLLQAAANMTGASAGAATASGDLVVVKETTGDANGSATASGASVVIVPTVGSSTTGGGGGTNIFPVFGVFD